MYTNDDPMIRLVRRSLNSAPKSIATLAAELRQDAGVSNDVGSLADSLAIAECCVFELRCIAVTDTAEKLAALRKEIQRLSKLDGEPRADPAFNEIIWRSPYYHDLNSAGSAEAAARR